MANELKSETATIRAINELLPQRSEFESNVLCLETWKCAFSPDDQLFAFSSGDSIVVLVNWSHLISKTGATSKRDNYSVIECSHLVRSVNFSLIANLHKSTAFWHRTTQFKEYFLITGHSSGRIKIWDIHSGKLLLELLDHKDSVSDIESTPYGILASTSFDGTLKFWDLMDGGNLLKTIKSEGRPLYGCRWSLDYKSLITVGMSKNANVYRTDTYCVRLKLEGHQHNVVASDFSPDSRLIVTVSWDTRVIVWNARNGDILRQFNQLKPPPPPIYASGENGHFIRSVAFSPDGAHLATCADDGVLRIWDLLDDEKPEAIGTIMHGLCCKYSNSGQVLAVGTRMGTVTVFESHSCVKSLLFLCRLAIGRHLQSNSMEVKIDIIPKRLINYLEYKDLT